MLPALFLARRPQRLRFLTLGLCICLAACGSRKPADRGPAKTYKIHGTVVRINAKDHTATIKGDAIPGWMDAMTMDYPIPDDNDWRSLQTGEVINATLEVRGLEYELHAVKPAAQPTTAGAK